MSLIIFKKFAPVIIGAISLLAAAAAPAAADTMSYYLGAPNTALNSYPGPYAKLTVDRTSSAVAAITFAGLTQTSGGNTYSNKLGGGSAVDVNVNSSRFSVSNISFTGGCTGPGCPDGGTRFGSFVSGAGNVSQFGRFNLLLKDVDGATDAVNSVTFTVNDLAGTWADAAAVLALNLDNYLGAAHVFVFNSAGSVVQTGFAGSGPAVTATPEAGPGVLFCLAVVFLGAAFVWRNRLARAV